MKPWTRAIVMSDVNDAMEKIVDVALTSMCECNLAATIDTMITLFSIRNQEEVECCQCLEATYDHTSPNFSVGWEQMAKYMQYLFNLHHNRGRIIIEHHVHLNAFVEKTILTSCELERMGCENTILHHGTLESLVKDLELQVTYHHLSKAENELNFTHQYLDLTHEKMDTRTHAIMHLMNAIEMQDLELEERVEMIATLEQQL
jgi:hypothetical protein